MVELNLACIVGARPNFIKMAPILRALQSHENVSKTLIHTGQHYDAGLSEVFFDQLQIPVPDVHLNIHEVKHGAQTGRMIEALEHVFEGGPPDGGRFDRVIVTGDVNSTMAAALAAVKLGIPVAHIEAGLRSFDRAMPEEINRIVTDSVSDQLFVSEPSGLENLVSEGHPRDSIHHVGNVMIDTLLQMLPVAKESDLLARLQLDLKRYGVVTFHRPSNVDKPESLKGIVDVLVKTSQHLPLVFPVHPRTRKRLGEFGLLSQLDNAQSIHLLEPLGYVECLALTSSARLMITDSGGLQEEATVLDVPCLTMRPNTERPITVNQGSSTLVDNDPARLTVAFEAVLNDNYKVSRIPELWDGKAAERIARLLCADDAEQPNSSTAVSESATVSSGSQVT